jgi:uncharacterized membrane protein YraQ (UPF0718 family)
LINLLIPAVTQLASGFLENRKEKAAAKQKLEVAKIEAQVAKVQSDAGWEESAIKASDNSWKDELWTVFFVLLIGACFVPALQPYIENGFRFLREDCPDWLSWGILASIAASFGLKSIGQFKK